MIREILVRWMSTEGIGLEESDIAMLLRELPGSRRAEIRESLRPVDRRDRALTHRLLGRMMAEAEAGTLGCLERDSRGRLQHPGACDVSVSHTEGLVCAAVAVGCRVGVDVERRRPIDTATMLATLHRDEQAGLPCDRTRREAEFYQAWTRKEAVAKADGRGLAIEPNRLPVCGQSTSLDGSTYWLISLGLPEGWTGALAHDGGRVIPIDARAYSFG